MSTETIATCVRFLQEEQFRLIDEFNPYLNAFSKEADRVQLRKQVRWRHMRSLKGIDGVCVSEPPLVFLMSSYYI